GYAIRNTKNKRRLDANQRYNRRQQPPFKRQNTGGQNVAKAYTAGKMRRKAMEELTMMCSKILRWSQRKRIGLRDSLEVSPIISKGM
nr:hypothetical protein [Tanacetum cinerariifolium]